MTPTPTPTTPAPYATFVEALTAWSTLAAALATTASVLFIAWQIRLTRKSVETTEHTLKIARDEFEHGRMLEVEAQKARIDAEMPRLFVATSNPPMRAYMTDEPFVEELGVIDSPEALPDRDFVMPRDKDVRIHLTSGFGITNEGPRRARLFIDSQWDPDQGREEVTIPPGGAHWIRIRRVHTLAEWIENHEARERGDAGDVPLAWVIYIYPGDVGAIERHRIVQGGSFLIPDAQRMGTWNVAKPAPGFDRTIRLGSIAEAVMPFTREYYASLSESRPLDAPSPS